MILQESVFLIKFIFLFFKIGLVHFEDIVVFVLYLYYKQQTVTKSQIVLIWNDGKVSNMFLVYCVKYLKPILNIQPRRDLQTFDPF